jgi:hypothetical protein
MGSLRLDGVWFLVFADDHDPPHVHARYAGVESIVELRPGTLELVRMRTGSLLPANAKRADVRHILRMAQHHVAELVSLWEELHG